MHYKYKSKFGISNNNHYLLKEHKLHLIRAKMASAEPIVSQKGNIYLWIAKIAEQHAKNIQTDKALIFDEIKN